MKNLSISLLVLLSLSAQAQLAINAGINYSTFIGQGNYGRANLGFAGGLSDKIKLSDHWYLQPALSYEKKGAYNKAEQWNFNVYSLVAESFIAYRVHSLYFMASPYYERVLYAGNSRFEGDGFGWSAGDKWKYWNQDQLGFTIAAQIDLNGALLHFELSQGISQVRGELKDHTGMANYTLWHNRNRVAGVRLVIPSTTFTN